MKCPGCGKEFTGPKRFCITCGTPLGEATTEIKGAPPAPEAQKPTTAITPPPSPGVAPAPAFAYPTGAGGRKTWIIVLAIVLGVLVVGGAVAGIVAWRVAASNRIVAEIESIDLEMTSGEDVDLREVPLDKEFAIVVRFRSEYKEGGKGVLELTVNESQGEKLHDERWQVKSSDRTQEKSTEKLVMSEGTGKPLKVQVSLSVSREKKKIEDTEALTFRVEKGKGIEGQLLDEAKEKALEKLKEAEGAIGSITALGIDASDLTLQVEAAKSDLEGVETEEQADHYCDFAEKVIAECNARRSAYEAEKKRQEEEARQQDIAACRNVMYNYVYPNRFPAEDFEIVDLNMNDQRTYATAGIVGYITVHTVPERAGEKIYGRITAEKRGGQWVVTDYEYGI